MNPKLRNAIAETVSILGIAYTAIPAWSAANYAPPAWVGLAITLAITVLNQLLKDYEKTFPAPPPAS